MSYIAGFFCKNDSLNPFREIMKDKDDKELKSGELSIYWAHKSRVLSIVYSSIWKMYNTPDLSALSSVSPIMYLFQIWFVSPI